jgi:hypothetical protein
VLSGMAQAVAEAVLALTPSLRNRVVVERLMDPEPVLRRASLTICHGGSGTVYQSLAKGVPLLCLPHNADQRMIAEYVAAAGVGKVRTEKDMNWGEAISQTIGCTAAARRLSRTLKAHDTRAHWLRWLACLTDVQATRCLRCAPKAGQGAKVASWREEGGFRWGLSVGDMAQGSRCAPGRSHHNQGRKSSVECT